ncbi:putative ACR [Xylophilus ampelinus]|nr:putative ACR [Xylophilus ampelinus]
MCDRYVSAGDREIERFWDVGHRDAVPWHREVAPGYMAPFLRPWRGQGLEVVVGRWGLIPRGSATRTPRSDGGLGVRLGELLRTHSVRSAEIESIPEYRDAWRSAQRCLIPVLAFDEASSVADAPAWWRFRAVDGKPFALAGVWSEWRDKQTGEVVSSFAMLTARTRGRPWLGAKSGIKGDVETQPPSVGRERGTQCVVVVEPKNFDRWLNGGAKDAAKLLRPPPSKCFAARQLPPSRLLQGVGARPTN